MSNVIDFNQVLILKKQNQFFCNEMVKKIDLEIKKWSLFQGDRIKKCFNEKNLSFLFDNYNFINRRFLSGVVSKNKVNLFFKKLNNQFEGKEDDYEKLVITLYFYYIYSVYAEDLFLLSDEKIKLFINVYSAFEDEHKMEDIDKICSFLFDDDIYQELINISGGYENIKYVCEDIVEEYLEYGVKNNIPVSFFAKNMIDYYKDMEKEKDSWKDMEEPFKIKKLTIEEVCSKIKPQVDGIISLMMSNGDENKNKVLSGECFYLKSNMDMLMFRLKNINKEDINDCLINIKKTWESNDSLINKLKNIFEYVNNFSYSSVKK